VYEHAPVIPSRVEVMTWFVFLLRELARPYRRDLAQTNVLRAFTGSKGGRSNGCRR